MFGTSVTFGTFAIAVVAGIAIEVETHVISDIAEIMAEMCAISEIAENRAGIHGKLEVDDLDRNREVRNLDPITPETKAEKRIMRATACRKVMGTAMPARQKTQTATRQTSVTRMQKVLATRKPARQQRTKGKKGWLLPPSTRKRDWLRLKMKRSAYPKRR